MGKILKQKQVVWLGLFLAILFDTVVQIGWKEAVSHIPLNANLLTLIWETIKQPIFIVVIITFILQVLNWLKVLNHADLSYAQPITALSYISVVAISVLYLGEQVQFKQIAGIGFILIGVWFISRTEHKTTDKESNS